MSTYIRNILIHFLLSVGCNHIVYNSRYTRVYLQLKVIILLNHNSHYYYAPSNFSYKIIKCTINRSEIHQVVYGT